jgi:Type II secretion system (T2SS), protein G
VRKLALMVVLWFAVSYYFPDSRRYVVDWTRFIWVPVVKWDTEQEMAQVARDVVNEEIKSGKLPDQRRWLQWLDYRYIGDQLKKDAWGSTYQLSVWADSVAIVSLGPDRERNTDDDFHVTVRRQRRRR